MADASTLPQRRLVRWSELHALALLIATMAVAAGASIWLVILVALGSFGALIARCRGAWSPSGRFGAANALTAARILGAAALPPLTNTSFVFVTCAVVLFALDAADGWLARKLGLSSEFGEYLDKEADAFFMLMLCLLLYATGRLGPWILGPGLLRYGFVVFLMLARPPAQKETRSAMGRWIYFGMISALIAAFTPFPALYKPWALLMTTALVYSFGKALVDVYGVPREHGGR
jgi:phosphatidylglycerophosphate synthase